MFTHISWVNILVKFRMIGQILWIFIDVEIHDANIVNFQMKLYSDFSFSFYGSFCRLYSLSFMKALSLASRYQRAMW